MEYDFTLADLFKAYFDCRKRKRCKISALKFELNLEENLLELYKEIKSGNYKVGRCIAFVVTKPKPREVWAANFRDRIVHHLIYNFLHERFYKRFIKDTYSCIPKRGTLNAAKRLMHFSRSSTLNYKREMFYLKADLSNFFVSIDKDVLYSQIEKLVPELWLQSLVKEVLYHDCTSNVYKKSPPKKFALIPHYKSLFYSDKKLGLPIGNLTSQFFSNIYLDAFDQYVKHNLKCKYYIRYVDDFVIIAQNCGFLNSCFKKIRDFLKSTLCIELNPRKKLINKVSNGIDFVGFIIKPHRMFLRKKTLNTIFHVVFCWKKNKNPFSNYILTKFHKTINSYLGMLVNTNGAMVQVALSNLVNCSFIHLERFMFKTVLA